MTDREQMLERWQAQFDKLPIKPKLIRKDPEYDYSDEEQERFAKEDE